MKWFKLDEKLPPNNTYILIHVPGRPWGDSSSDGKGLFYKVAKFVEGLSQKDRDALPEDNMRKKTWRGCDENSGNNLTPYYFEEFGPGTYFGQEVNAWAFIEYVCPLGSVVRKDLNL
jgi:hypothetical protein